ncbi:MAG: CDP-diacylglycerol--glycerol-3-phosphate 3-phosphatidyltransferase [Clostridia bacterium]|nr:CDP-diacylglycerol--glycerol-3-phosphate 3-phosphatidyltransferase [Clostridia bacterium]
MNWPNRLSILRVCCVPVLILLLALSEPWCRWAAAAVFALASFSDFLDGYLARKNGWVTTFGKFIDPVADKLLVVSSLILLTSLSLVPAWMTVLILARELSVDGLRMIAISNGKVIAAGPLGKIKTASQMLMILMVLILRTPLFSWPVGIILGIWVCLITLWSGIDYFRKNMDLFS